MDTESMLGAKLAVAVSTKTEVNRARRWAWFGEGGGYLGEGSVVCGRAFTLPNLRSSAAAQPSHQPVSPSSALTVALWHSTAMASLPRPL